MIELQCINKCLSESKFQFLLNNGINEDYFTLYKEEFIFIKNHFQQYHNVPDRTTFLSKFPDFNLHQIRESDEYIIDKLRENYLYTKSVPHIEQAAKLLSVDANKAVEYINTNFSQIVPAYNVNGVDFVESAMERYQHLQKRKENPNQFRYSFGLDKLDYHTMGIQKRAELIVIFARSGIGKTWLGTKISLELWKQGANVGIISPEMTSEAINYRLDTMLGHFSNFHLKKATSFTQDDEYLKYLQELSNHKNKLITSTVKDFNKEITITKLKAWILANKFDAVLIDGIGYLKDERYKRGDSETKSLTNISEDLMSLSIEIGVPIIIVHQANREVMQGETIEAPELHHLRGSDGIAHNSSKVLSLYYKDKTLSIKLTKNRDGDTGNTLLYLWDIDKGYFKYIPSDKSGIPEDKEEIEQLVELTKDEDVEDIF